MRSYYLIQATARRDDLLQSNTHLRQAPPVTGVQPFLALTLAWDRRVTGKVPPASGGEELHSNLAAP